MYLLKVNFILREINYSFFYPSNSTNTDISPLITAVCWVYNDILKFWLLSGFTV
jgi:hypothetical protein